MNAFGYILITQSYCIYVFFAWIWFYVQLLKICTKAWFKRCYNSKGFKYKICKKKFNWILILGYGNKMDFICTTRIAKNIGKF